MAKYECQMQGNIKRLTALVENGILSGSASANLEEKSDMEIDGITVCVRVFERYSMLGKNRVSLSVTLAGNQDKVSISAIASGGVRRFYSKSIPLEKRHF